LRHAALLEFGLHVSINRFVPQQATALALLSFELGALGLELVNEQAGVRAVIGTAKKGHGGQSVRSKNKGFWQPLKTTKTSMMAF
jgi:hypothetical protein